MSHIERFPNLFIVGAPKCGTTSMAYWLGQHPEIFAPGIKEPTYFGSDLISLEKRSRPTKENYFRHYEAWELELYALDSSPLYILSETAAEEIAKTVPDPRIIIMVRNPVESCYALYHQAVFNKQESAPTFEEALALEQSRREGRNLPTSGIAQHFQYRSSYLLSSKIRQYLEFFPKKQIQVLLLDDVASDAKVILNMLLEWLGLDTTPTIDMSARNTAKKALSHAVIRFAQSPPPWAGRIASPLLTKSTRARARAWLEHVNTRKATNPPMLPETRKQLGAFYAEEIESLSHLLDRDLSCWLENDS